MSNEPEIIRITLDDVENIKLPPPGAVGSGNVRKIGEPSASGGTGRDYGSVDTFSASAETGGPIWLKSWFYLGLAGLVGAFLAWAICEPTFSDETDTLTFGSAFMFPMMAVFMSVGFASADSAISQAWGEFIKKFLLAVFVGGILAFIAEMLAGLIMVQGVKVLLGDNPESTPQQLLGNPALWFLRGFAWLTFGAVAGILYGLFDKSGKKVLYGFLGGMAGAFIGGLLFDPINYFVFRDSASLSRVVGMCILGLITGVAIGLVENALKEKWLYIMAGPLAGKQFVLYKDRTTMGSSQSCDIYLFKDTTIQPAHAIIQNIGKAAQITAAGVTLVNNRPVTSQRLNSGDSIQIGKYTFLYHEKQKA
jgi:hypothetical protein